MDKMKEYMVALRNGTSYDWIANHGWELSKDELINIIKEFDYATSYSIDAEDIYDKVAINLEEMYEEE